MLKSFFHQARSNSTTNPSPAHPVTGAPRHTAAPHCHGKKPSPRCHTATVLAECHVTRTGDDSGLFMQQSKKYYWKCLINFDWKCILLITPCHSSFRPSTHLCRLNLPPPILFDMWFKFCNSWVSLNAIDLKCSKEGENDLSLGQFSNVAADGAALSNPQ